MCDSAGMAQEVCVIVGMEDRARLAAIIGDRNRPQKHIQRARIVLLSADRLPVLAVARRAGTSRPAVWRWQQRFAEAGVDGLLRDKTRKPGKKAAADRDCRQGAGADPAASRPARRPIGPAGMAKAVGLSLRAVQRIWEANRLQPHRIRTFKTVQRSRPSPRRSKMSSAST